MESIKKFRLVFGFLLTANILFLVNNIKNTYFSSVQYAKEAVAYNRMLDYIVQRPQIHSLGFYIDMSSAIPYEFIFSVLTYVSSRRDKPDHIYIKIDHEKENIRNSFDQLLLDALKKKFKNLEDVPRGDRDQNTWIVGEALPPADKLDSIALFTENYSNVSFFHKVEVNNSVQFFIGKYK